MSKSNYVGMYIFRNEMYIEIVDVVNENKGQVKLADGSNAKVKGSERLYFFEEAEQMADAPIFHVESETDQVVETPVETEATGETETVVESGTVVETETAVESETTKNDVVAETVVEPEQVVETVSRSEYDSLKALYLQLQMKHNALIVENESLRKTSKQANPIVQAKPEVKQESLSNILDALI